MADRAEILRQFRERNYNVTKGKPVPQVKPVKIEDLQKIADPPPQTEKKKRGRKPKTENELEGPKVAEKKKRGPRGPYKKRNK